MFSMDRPVTATFRPQAAAASSTCWMRWTLEAKVVTMIRSSQFWNCRCEGGAHGLFRRGEAGPLHVGGVGAQAQHALLAQLAQAGQVDDLPVNGGGVDLEVAGVDHGAHLGVDGEGHGVGDGVVHMDELHVELAGPDSFAGLHGDELGGSSPGRAPPASA